MRKVLNLGLVACGFILATIATTSSVQASSEVRGGCERSGHCGTTANGTELVGKWVEYGTVKPPPSLEL